MSKWLQTLPRAASERVKLAVLAINEARRVMETAPHPDPVRIEAVAAFLRELFAGRTPEDARTAAGAPYGSGAGAAIQTMLVEFADAVTLAAEMVERFGIGDVVIVWTPTGFTLGLVEGSQNGEALFVAIAGDRVGVAVAQGACEVITIAYHDPKDRDRWRGAHAGLRPGQRLTSAAAVLSILEPVPGREPKRPAKRASKTKEAA